MGEALGFLRYAKQKLDESVEAARSYRRSLGKKSGRVAADDVTVAPAFAALGTKLKAALDKVEYENKMIHRKEVPTRLPPLIPSKSLITAEPFELPPVAAAWHSAEFHEGRVYLKGENDDADKACPHPPLSLRRRQLTHGRPPLRTTRRGSRRAGTSSGATLLTTFAPSPSTM